MSSLSRLNGLYGNCIAASLLGGGHGRVQDDLVLVTKESVVKVARRNSVKADVLALRLNVNDSF